MILENAPLKEEKEETAPESSPAPEPVVKTLEEKKIALKTTLQEFLHGHTIYDVLPMNGQVLVFNTELPLFEAITALAEHNIFCGVLWDEKKNEFSDLFTIRDIMEILIFATEQIDLLYPNKGHLITEEEKYINEIVTVMETTDRTKLAPMETEELEKPKLPKPKESEAALQGYPIIFALLKKIKLLDWQRVFGKDKKSPNILINKNLKNSLLEACVEMADKKIHRLAIIEKGKEKDNTTLCGIVTHDMIMSYIIANLQGDPSIFDVPVKELSIGTSNPVSASIDSTLYQVLLMMKKKKISFIPLVAESRSDKGTGDVAAGFFSLKDLIMLIRKKRYHMMKLSMQGIINILQIDGDRPDLGQAAHEAMENTEEELSASIRMMSISGELPGEVMEEIKYDQLLEKKYGIERLFTYAPEDPLKQIIEKIVAAPDKRLISYKKGTNETLSVISITDIFNYVTK